MSSEAAPRKLAAAAFLLDHGWGGATRRPLAGDASFRRYERLLVAGGNGPRKRAILMDAPPGTEDVKPFRAVARYLRGRGYSAPEVMAADPDHGFLLLEDLGDDLYSRVLDSGAGRPGSEQEALYGAAVDLLVDLHGAEAPASLPVTGQPDYILPTYDQALLMAEAALFTDWYIPALGDQVAVDHEGFAGLWTDLLGAHLGGGETRHSSVLVLRDYHAENLIWLPRRAALSRVGLLDFQDAVRGHPAYDLVSLLEDARRQVAPELADWAIDRYLRAAPDLDRAAFRLAYGLLGAQRNTKIIGIFTRLWRRDGKPAYLKMLPHVWRLLERDLRTPGLEALRHWYDRAVPAALRGQTLAGSP